MLIFIFFGLQHIYGRINGFECTLIYIYIYIYMDSVQVMKRIKIKVDGSVQMNRRY